MRFRDLFHRNNTEGELTRALREAARQPLDPAALADPYQAGYTQQEVIQALEAAATPEAEREATFTAYFAEPEQHAEYPEHPEYPEDQATTRAADPRWTRAVELYAEFDRAMTLENTPAAFATDQYDYSDDVWCDDIYDTPGSVAIEKELGAHVREHPELFAGTKFEAFGHDEDEHGEDHDRPPETEDREHAEDEDELAF